MRSSSLLAYDTVHSSLNVTRTNILNTLADRYKYRSYLEIGQGVRQQNHDWINCAIRIGVDPDPSVKAAYQMTSDEFFKINKDSFDLIFIDGDHTEEQVRRDILNSLKDLNKNGTIVVHDCNPASKAMQRVPPVQQKWTGKVWKIWVKLRATRSDLRMYVVNADNGCGVIRRGKQSTISLPETLDYEEFDRNRIQWLNLVSVDWFVAKMRTVVPMEEHIHH